MPSIFSNIGPEIPLALLLMAILALRAKVWPHASLFIRATPAAVFELIDMAHGKRENWGRTSIHAELIDAERGIFRKTYDTTLPNGDVKTFTALFSIRSREAPVFLEIQREGLAGRPLNNELLSQTFAVTPERDGCRLSITYEWGPRPLIGQLMARADLWGGAFRLRSMAERGVPVEWPYQVISAGIAILTGAISVAAFAMLLNWQIAVMVIFALFVHELGHLLAYRLMGQPWGRMVFLPFLGAIAMPKLPFDSQGQSVFAALMGPGFSMALVVLCSLHIGFDGNIEKTLLVLGLITVFLNIFNLLPAEPLDGGVALRSVLAKYLGSAARFGLMGIGAVIALVGLAIGQPLLIIFGVIAIAFNLKKRSIDAGLQPLSRLQVVITFFGYVCMITAYVTMMQYFLDKVMKLEPNGQKIAQTAISDCSKAETCQLRLTSFN
jgi:Zn-dependent protease